MNLDEIRERLDWLDNAERVARTRLGKTRAWHLSFRATADDVQAAFAAWKEIDDERQALIREFAGIF